MLFFLLLHQLCFAQLMQQQEIFFVSGEAAKAHMQRRRRA